MHFWTEWSKSHKAASSERADEAWAIATFGGSWATLWPVEVGGSRLSGEPPKAEW